MKRTIVLSKKSEAYIGTCPESDYAVVRTDDPAEEIGQFLSSPEREMVLVLFFIHVSEYEKLFKTLRKITENSLFYTMVVFGSVQDMQSDRFSKLHHISEFRSTALVPEEIGFIIEKSFSIADAYCNDRQVQDEYFAKLVDTKQDQDDLINIGRSLSSEKDPEKLLFLILFLSKKITGADAGSIYLVETDEKGKKRMRFKTSHTFSREIPLNEFVMDLDKKSIAGYVAVTGEVLNIPDVYKLPEQEAFSFTHNSSFDRTHSYYTRSMLVVPMRNYQDEIIGVIQLINSKEDLHNRENTGNEAFTLKLETMDDFDQYVVPFDDKYDSLLEAIAGQAAIAIENNRMIKQIQNQFEEFVRASVTAIESRDPATSGHSFRVAEICKAMAQAINDIQEGYLKDFHFSETAIREIEFAALLHDFGKVYVDLNIFKKEKKLYPKDLENLMIRLDYLFRFVELQYNLRESRILQEINETGDTALRREYVDVALEKERMLIKIKEIKERVRVLNEPTITERNPVETVDTIMNDINSIHCIDIDGNIMDIITDYDRTNLIIQRGSLNPVERKEIESHVVHTYNFVSKIPWPPEYKNIPEIALRHHEKINGTGYPDGLKGRESTLIQARIMAIADIYDALAAPDRPYKKAVPRDKVLSILQEEVERGVLDKDLVDVFIEKRIFEKVNMDLFRYEVTPPA